MAAVAAPSDPTEMMQNLSLDSQNKPHQVNDHSNKNAPVQYASFVNGAQSNGSSMQFDRSTTPFADPNMFTYQPSTYYYGAFNGSSVGEWDGYANPNGVEMPSAVYSDYQNSYSYAPYGPYSSSSAPLGYDNQMYSPQQYQYPTPYFQPSAVNGTQYTPNRSSNASRSDVASIGADQMQMMSGLALANQSSAGNVSNNRMNMSQSLRPNHSKTSAKTNDFYHWGTHPSGSGNSSAFSYESSLPLERNHGLQSPHLMGMHHTHTASVLDYTRFGNPMYTNTRMYGQYPSTLKNSSGYIPMNNYSRNARTWTATTDNKYKIRGYSNSLSAYSNGNADGRNELNKGPRGKILKDLKDSEPITIAVRGQSLPVKAKTLEEDKSAQFLDKEQYNRDDFAETLSDAKFFIIKSYSEDDVHKSIKYGVWASTPNGNKKLDAAYKEALEKSDGCPVFLLFSVNASGQFVGLAEMVGPVDFDRCVEYWQQDKWTGCFNVKWHIVKDIPNSMLRHITLENNDSKPVTNSRDTQEVKFEQGIEIIKILKGHSSKTCILDDFEFYEGRQKTMQERKAKQKQLDNKQVGGVTLTGTDSADTNTTDKAVPIGDADSKAVET